MPTWPATVGMLAFGALSLLALFVPLWIGRWRVERKHGWFGVECWIRGYNPASERARQEVARMLGISPPPQRPGVFLPAPSAAPRDARVSDARRWN